MNGKHEGVCVTNKWESAETILWNAGGKMTADDHESLTPHLDRSITSLFIDKDLLELGCTIFAAP